MSQGMAYGNWHFAENYVNDLTIHIQINGDTNRMPGRYFQLYDGNIGGIGSYFGFQTDVKKPGHGGQGHGLIFSRWDTRDSTDARIAMNGWIENSGHEGDFVGVRICFPWTTGDYICVLAPVETDNNGTWYEFKVTSKKTRESISAGCLRFPRSGIQSGGGSWTEVYSGADCESDIPFTEMRITYIAGNNNSVHPIKCVTKYHENFVMSDAFVSESILVLRSGGGIQREHEPKQYPLST